MTFIVHFLLMILLVWLGMTVSIIILYLYKKKTQVVFFIFHLKWINSSNSHFYLMIYECPVLCHRPTRALIKHRNEKNYLGFLFQNIGNIEAFLQNLNLSAKILFCSFLYLCYHKSTYSFGSRLYFWCFLFSRIPCRTLKMGTI